MDFATPKDDVRAIDCSVRNKWRWWDWLETDMMKQYIKKTKQPGQAFCTICNRTLQYQSGGKKDLKRHMDSPPHTQAMKAVKTSYSLAGMFFGSPSSESETPKPAVRPVVPVNDRRLNSEAMILGFIAEHDLPYTLAPQLVNLTKEMAKDPKSLTEMKLEDCTASYKMIHGLSKFFEGELMDELRHTKFCLNLDESTNTNNQKIVAMLVSYFSKEKREITVRHLCSFEVTRADAQSIFDKVEEMFIKYELPWENLLSVLLDSCNTMRGKKSGLETRLREKAPNMLDIDGDSVHHVHNAAKAFTTPFQRHLESLFNTLHSDFHWSTDLRSELKTVCAILNIKYSTPERFTSHRFLSAHSLAVDTARLLDAYTVFYFGFMHKKEKLKYESLFNGIIERRHVSEESKLELQNIAKRVSKKKLTEDGQNRKDKISMKLFNERTVTRMMLGIYMSSLMLLKDYAVFFQTKSPLLHVLHDEQLKLVRNFMGYFVKPQCLPSSVHKLKLMDFEDEILLPLNDMFMGAVASKLAVSSKCKDVKMVLLMLKTAYIKAGTVLLKKMPLENRLLQSVSAIDPSARGHSLTIKYLKGLPELVKNSLSDNEEDNFMSEIYRYQSDSTLHNFLSTDRIDHWWAAQDRYPAMRKMALTLLSCFHGPMVEGTFNLMGDIMDSKSSSLSIESLNALQNVKSTFRSKEVSAVKYFSREDTLYTPIVKGLAPHMNNASKERNRVLNEKRLEKEEKRNFLQIPKRTVLTKRSAQELVADNVRQDCVDHANSVAKQAKLG